MSFHLFEKQTDGWMILGCLFLGALPSTSLALAFYPDTNTVGEEPGASCLDVLAGLLESTGQRAKSAWRCPRSGLGRFARLELRPIEMFPARTPGSPGCSIERKNPKNGHSSKCCMHCAIWKI